LSGSRFGGFLIEAPIAKGSMGAVYRARDEKLERSVAIKALPRETVSHDPVLVKRFLQEAQLASRLNHDHVARIYDVGEALDHYFIAMEFVGGGTLDQWVKQNGPVSAKKAAKWMAQTCAALHEAHRHGITHRDIKPANLMLTGNGQIKVADFGLAKIAGAVDRLTKSRRVVGTPYYMSPEQCRGADATPQSDIYCLGGAFYFIVVGEPPFAADTLVGVAYKHVNDPVPDPRSIAQGLDDGFSDIVMRCMRKRPEDRQQDAIQIIKALADLSLFSADDRREVLGLLSSTA
jgi:serine/threonine protein kinase